MMDCINAKEVINGLSEYPFICGEDFIETNNGYTIIKTEKFEEYERINEFAITEISKIVNDNGMVAKHKEYFEKILKDFDKKKEEEYKSMIKKQLNKDIIVSMLFANSSNNDGYFKGMCDAYEKILMPNKQEENMQKAREAFAELRKSLANLNNNNDVPKSAE